MCHALFVSASVLFPRVFQGSSGRRNRMRSRRRDGLKGKGADPPRLQPLPPPFNFVTNAANSGRLRGKFGVKGSWSACTGWKDVLWPGLMGVEWSGWVVGWRMSENKRTFQPGCLPVRKTGVGTAATLPKCVAIFFLCVHFFYALRIAGRKVAVPFHSPDDLVRVRVVACKETLPRAIKFPRDKKKK